MLVEEVAIPVGEQSLEATLTIPDEAIGFVICATHDREPLRALLATRRIASLAVAPQGESSRTADALVAILDSMIVNGLDRGLPIGILGSGSAALVAASRRPDLVTAVVAFGVHDELAIETLEGLRAATLFVVGSSDLWGIRLARGSAQRTLASTHVVVVPGAGPNLAAPGVIEEIAEHADRWFEEHFRREAPVKISAVR